MSTRELIGGRRHLPTLLSTDLDDQLSDQGLVEFVGFEPDEIEELHQGYAELVAGDERGFQLDHLRSDRGQVARLAALAQPVWERLFERVFVDHRPVLSSFLAKHPGDGSGFGVHRDITAHDDRSLVNYTVWVPLVDVSRELANGTLEVVDGSHRIPSGFDGVDASVSVSPYLRWMEQFRRPLALGAGTGAVYDARMIHGSGPNLGSTTRLAIGCMVARRDRSLVFVMPTGRRGRALFQVDEAFYLQHHPGEVATTGMPLGTVRGESFSCDPYIDPRVVREALGTIEEPSREVLVPEDLLVDLTPGSDPLPMRAIPRVCDRDLSCQAGQFDAPAGRIGGIQVERVVGGVGVKSLDLRAGRPHTEVERLATTVASSRIWSPRSALLLVLDQWARLTFRLDQRPPRRYRLGVIECPGVGAGVVTVEGRRELDLGIAVELETRGGVTVWNNGPGPLVVVLTSSRGRRARSTDH